MSRMFKERICTSTQQLQASMKQKHGNQPYTPFGPRSFVPVDLLINGTASLPPGA